MGDALALAAQGKPEVHAAGVFDEDVEVGLRGVDVEGHGDFVETAIEGAVEYAVEINLRVVVDGSMTRSPVTGDDRGAVKDVAVGLIDFFHGEGLIGVDGRGQRIPQRARTRSRAKAGMRMARAMDGIGGGVMPVSRAMTSRNAMYFGVGRPLSSSAAS